MIHNYPQWRALKEHEWSKNQENKCFYFHVIIIPIPLFYQSSRPEIRFSNIFRSAPKNQIVFIHLSFKISLCGALSASATALYEQ